MRARLTGSTMDGPRVPTRRARARGARAAVAAVLVVLLAVLAEPGYAGGPSAAPAQAAADLGTVRAEGVTLTDSLGSFGQANAYTFRVGDGPGSVQVYVGDLWYDVEVLLLRGSALTDDPSQWRTMPCSAAAGCVASAPGSARRRVQYVQPKGLIEPVETGSYAVVVRPRDEADFSAWRTFTLRVVVTPPVCAVSGDAESSYRVALAMTPSQARRADLVTLTAYVLPPFGDLFDFEWSVDGRRLASSGPVAQALAFDLAGSQSGSHAVQVMARGVRAYPDPDQPEVPPSLSAGCSLTIG
jgi:hypothetical protein